MADWWNKLKALGQKVLTQTKAFDNPHQLEKEVLDSLAQYLEPVGDKEPELMMELMRFVVDGSGDESLLKLQGSGIAASSLGYRGNFNNVNKVRVNLMSANRRMPGEVWVRIAQVNDAAFHAQRLALPASLAGSQSMVPGAPNWLTLFLTEIVYNNAYNYSGDRPTPWSTEEIVKILKAANLPSDLLVKYIIDCEAKPMLGYGSFFYGNQTPLTSFSGIKHYFEQYAQTVEVFLKRAKPEQQTYALGLLKEMKFDCSLILQVVVEIATATSKPAREAASVMLMDCRAEARPVLETMLSSAGASERHEAVLSLWRLFGADCNDLFKEHLSREKAERVKQTINKLLAVPESTAENNAAMELPPLACEVGTVALPDEIKQLLAGYLIRGHESWKYRFEQQWKEWNSPTRPAWVKKPDQPIEIPQKTLAALIKFIEEGGPKPDIPPNQILSLTYTGKNKGYLELLTPPAVKLIHFIRILYLLDGFTIQVRNGDCSLWWPRMSVMNEYSSLCDVPFGLRELDACVASLPGCETGVFLKCYLAHNTRWWTLFNGEPDAVWPAFAEQTKILHEVLAPRGINVDYSYDDKRENAFQVLSLFPQLPGELIAPLWDIALGEGKSERPLAQAALKSLPDKASKIMVSLQDGKQNIRAAAAEWLGHLDDKSAIEPLKKAFIKEKHEAVKGTIMHSLDLLGADVDEFLDRDKLAGEAKAGLAKKLPKGMEWVPLDTLPTMHFADSGKEVDPSIVRWWVVQCIQQKSPICGPLLKRYLKMCTKADTNALARFILSSFIAHDTAHLSAEEVAARAKQESDKLWAIYGQNQNWITHYGSKEKLYQEWVTRISSDFVHSAVDQKGMLAIVSAAGDAACVKICDQYIRKWFGNKLAQCKCLVEVLSEIDHPLALQSLLSFANRFRTKAVKQLAEERVRAIADTNGWTLDELADRTIPDAGFARPADANGEPTGHVAVLELDYGPRQFQVTLNDKLEPVIVTKGESKAVKTMPEPGKSDDAELAKCAKKEFSDAKKSVKEVLKRQQERLYEALCTQRSWSYHDWRLYLAEHPIVGRLCLQLVWAAFSKAPESVGVATQKSATDAPQATKSGEKFLGCFRPMEDGSLTNERDEDVKLADDTTVILAHTCNVPESLGAEWQKHLEDYDVKPLFQQFGRATYELPKEMQNATEITDFEGHTLTAFKLRGKATKLGYLRGEAEDGGWFNVYRKTFQSLGIQAVIEFTGSPLPEEDRVVALIDVHFINITNKTSSSWAETNMPLGRVPPVLLSECLNDVKQISAEGAGFDPKWKVSSGY